MFGQTFPKIISEISYYESNTRACNIVIIVWGWGEIYRMCVCVCVCKRLFDSKLPILSAGTETRKALSSERTRSRTNSHYPNSCSTRCSLPCSISAFARRRARACSQNSCTIIAPVHRHTHTHSRAFGARHPRTRMRRARIRQQISPVCVCVALRAANERAPARQRRKQLTTRHDLCQFILPSRH